MYGRAPNAIAIGSWHEQQVSDVATQADSAHDNGELPTLRSIDHPGLRRFGSRAHIELTARRQLEALEARNKTYHGESTVRTLAPGTTFVFTDHAIHDADRQGDDSAATFAVIGVTHRGRNNLSSDAGALTRHAFANTAIDSATPAPASPSLQDEPLYHNRFSALRADIPWRPLREDGRGARLHPKPTVRGVQTAIVVGNDGDDLTTERDHRVKVQMHW